MKSSIRDQMFHEMRNKNGFEQAKKYAYDYADKAIDRNVAPTCQALENLEQFKRDQGSILPTHSTATAKILSDLHQYGSPATQSQIGGRYFGLVNGGVVPAALAARWLSDFWDQNTPLYVTSPIASVLEEITESWLKQLFGLADSAVAGFVSGSSMAILAGLAAGRYRLFQNQGWDINKKGFHGAPTIRIVAGAHAHGTVVKAAALLGFGIDNIEWVDVDEQGRIKVDEVPELDDTTILILQAGNVNSGAFDDFATLCTKANTAKAWVHVDGAFGLWAAGASELAHLVQGIELAQSFSVDGHKTLNTPYDNGIVLCSDKEALVNALQATGAYIVYSEQRDGMLYTPEMSRRARVVELWATLKYLGRSGIDELVDGLHQRAQQFAAELSEQRFTIHNDIVFNQILVSCQPALKKGEMNTSDKHSDAEDYVLKLIEKIQDSGECWVGKGAWRGQTVIRISVCSWATTAADITRSVQAFVNARDALDAVDQ